MLTGALKSLFALSEAYPDLKANQNFRRCRRSCSAPRARSPTPRQFYNEAVQSYNTKTQTFPASLLAARFGFKQRQYFEADDTSPRPGQRRLHHSPAAARRAGHLARRASWPSNGSMSSGPSFFTLLTVVSTG